MLNSIFDVINSAQHRINMNHFPTSLALIRQTQRSLFSIKVAAEWYALGRTLLEYDKKMVWLEYWSAQ